MAMPFAIGGGVANRSASGPSRAPRRRPRGSAMQRWAAPRLMWVVGALAFSIFWSALAKARGLRVNCALIASARYSRLRLTANASTCAPSGATSHDTIHTATSTSNSGPPPPFFRPPPPPPPIDMPPRTMRAAPSCISATAPTRAASVVISRTSRFFTCPSSWATTAWSSSRLHNSSRPRVTARCAWAGSVPVAKALGSGPSTTPMRRRAAHFPRPGGPQHLLRSRGVGVPGDGDRERRQHEAEPGERVVIRRARRLAGGEVKQVIAAEAQPGEERDETDHQQRGAAAVGLLLLEQIQRRAVAHAFGLLERSTCGTARSAWSSTSHSSAGRVPARPATRLVGNCCCLMLYWVAVSL